jgi:O-acetyl-ADP-ribose deacetylase (regulator of RNase III)
VGASSVAFPLISSGAYGWPVEDALRQAIGVLRESGGQVRLVLWQESVLREAQRVLAAWQ